MNSLTDHINYINITEDKKSVLGLDEKTAVTRNSDGTPKSFLYDLKWDYRGEIKGAIHKTSIVSFTHISMAIRRDIQKALYLISLTSPVGISGLLGRRHALEVIATCLETSDWSKLDSEICYREFEKALKSRQYSITTIKNIITCLKHLYIADLTIRVIDNKNYKFTNRMICTTKKTPKQSIAIPENMASKIFGLAMDTIEKYHPHRNEISKAYSSLLSCKKEVLAKTTNINTVSKKAKEIKHSIPDFKLDLNFYDGIRIQVACLLILQGFSGVRVGESLSFNKQSYSTIPFSNDFDIPVIKGEQSKPNKDGKVTQEVWVTHPIAKKALELAYDMGHYAREIYRERLINYHIDTKKKHMREIESAFILLSVNKQKQHFLMTSSTLNKSYSEFIVTHNIIATQDDVEEFNLLNPTRKNTLQVGGFLPKISPHDFRRTFAVFLVRNKIGNLMALRHQYKHLNTVMTAWYANHSNLAAVMDFEKDSDLLKVVKEANEELNTDIIYNIYNETESLSGKEGERIAGLRSEYEGSIYMSRKEIRAQVRNGSLSIVEHPTGYCTNPTCDRICATDTSSITCQHEIVTLEKAKLRAPVRKRLITKFNALNDEKSYMASILTQIYTGIKAIELTLKKHGIGFTPFEAEIKSQTMLRISE